MGWPLRDAAALATGLSSHGWRVVAADVLPPTLPKVLATGPELAPADAAALLREAALRDPRAATRLLVFGAGERPELFQDFVDHDRLFFLARRPPDGDACAELIAAALADAASRPAHVEDDPADDEAQGRLFELLRRLGRETDQASALRQIAIELRSLGDADAADAWAYDPAAGELSTPDPESGESRRESAVAGLLGFVARTARPLRLAEAARDGRYDPELDAPTREAGAAGSLPAGHHLLAVPVVLPGEPARVLAVLALHRGPTSPPFGESEQQRVDRAAALLAPALARLLLQDELERRAKSRHAAMREDMAGVFRGQALDHYQRGLPDEGHLLEIAPEWLGRAYAVIVAFLVAALIGSLVARLDEYAEGVAVVRTRGGVEITAPVGGTVSAVEVSAGRPVAAGDLLVRLYGAEEAAELARLRREFELGLLDRLRRPADRQAAARLGELRAATQLAEARLEQRSIRAPAAGRLGDVRVAPGQLLSPGEVIASLAGPGEERRLLAVLPGRFRPHLAVGQPLRLELDGFRYAYQQLQIASVSDRVFGNAEARRFLGPGGGDLLAFEGPVVVVEAHLPRDHFQAEGRDYEFRDGLSGRVEVRVRSDRVLFALAPALKWLVEDGDG